jgi:hypothetical protein
MNAKPQQMKMQQPIDTTEYFLKCNPSVIPQEAVAVRQSGSFLKGHNTAPLDGRRCTSEEVSVIRGMLDTSKFLYEATVPDPYLYPAHVLEALLAMDVQTLRFAINNYEKRAQKMGNLGSLVKLFAWGIPLHANELWGALGGDDVVEALNRCNIIRKCAGSSVYTSTVQLFAIKDTSVIVATDWPVSSLSLRPDEQPVQVIDQSTMSLAHNVPDAQGSRAIDLASNGGLLGIMAAEKGAKDVMVFQQNPRGEQFAKFNTWLNLMSNQVKVYRDPLDASSVTYTQLSKVLGESPDLYLVLAHPTGPQKETIIRAALSVGRNFLSPKGSMVMSIEDQHCESFAQDYQNSLCAEDLNGTPIGLAGSVVCRNDNETLSDGADGNSQESIVYGWQALWTKDKEFRENNRRCSDFKVFHLTAFDGAAGPQACQYARSEMMCSQTGYKTSTVLQNILSSGSV